MIKVWTIIEIHFTLNKVYKYTNAICSAEYEYSEIDKKFCEIIGVEYEMYKYTSYEKKTDDELIRYEIVESWRLC